MSDRRPSTEKAVKHTAGPWKVVRDPNEMPGIFTEKNEPICDVYEHGAPDAAGNASLLAAAPDLLDALVLARTWVALRIGDDHPDLRRIEAAIRKATGQ